MKRVSRSYLKTFRWVTKNVSGKLEQKNLNESQRVLIHPRKKPKRSKYRTLFYVIGTNRLSLRFLLAFMDLLYVSHCGFGLFIYITQYDNIVKSNSTLLIKIFPLLSGLGILMFLRFLATSFFFLVVPFSSVRLQRRIFMKLGGGLYDNAKFPMMKYREYVLQLQRFDLLALNEFDQEDRSKARCQLCN